MGPSFRSCPLKGYRVAGLVEPEPLLVSEYIGNSSVRTLCSCGIMRETVKGGDWIGNDPAPKLSYGQHQQWEGSIRTNGGHRQFDEFPPLVPSWLLLEDDVY